MRSIFRIFILLTLSLCLHPAAFAGKAGTNSTKSKASKSLRPYAKAGKKGPNYRGSYQHGRDKINSHPTYTNQTFESDHFPPNAAYKGTVYEGQSKYGNRPAFPLEKSFHQFAKGTGGFGGHASSTGSTLVSSGSNGYTARLNQMMRNNDFYGAMKTDIIDKQNVGRMRLNNPNSFNDRMEPGVKNAFDRGWVNETQYYDLLSRIGKL